MVKYSKHKESTQVPSRPRIWEGQARKGWVEVGSLYLLTRPRPYLVVVMVGVSDGSMI